LSHTLKIVVLALVGVATTASAASAQSAITRPDRGRDSLTTVQVENLVLLGKVWGFAKYHHPRITRGQVDWDLELRRVLPSVLSARGHESALSAITEWLVILGTPETCQPCAVLPDAAQLKPDVDWIRDERKLGHALSVWLVTSYQNRRTDNSQRYVTFVPNVGNPIFTNETEYKEALPSHDLRLLGLYRFWNIIEYWFPYRDVMQENWDTVLREFVRRVWMSDTQDAYRLSMMALIARVHDGHANLWSSLDVRPPTGSYSLPVILRFVEGKAVVTGFANDTLGAASGLRVGDVILRIGGDRVDSLVTAWAPLYAASNQAARLRDMARAITRGPSGRVRVIAERNGSKVEVEAERFAQARLDPRAGFTHDLPGETFQRLTKDVAYLKLSSVSNAQAGDYIGRAEGAKVLVIDIRNYPREFMVFSLGSHLVSEKTDFARFTASDAANPGAFLWTPPISLYPQEPRFAGSVVILIDETSQSQAEYTAMAFRSARNALVVGSTTAGADGNVSRIPLPGGLISMISGIGVFYPDRKPTQRVGIVPELMVQPTIAGIREGRDEVLEAAVSRALGRPFRLPLLP
jgi:C-terminal processing protease CtpA/Prc